MGVTVDMRTLRSGQEIVDKILARDPIYRANEIVERTNAFVLAWNKHYVHRRRRAVRERELAKEEEWKTRIRALNALLSTREPPKPKQKKHRRITWIKPGQ